MQHMNIQVQFPPITCHIIGGGGLKLMEEGSLICHNYFVKKVIWTI